MQLLRRVNTLRALKNDPFGFVIDSLIKIVVNLVIPIPLAGNVVAQFRGPVLGFLASIVILGIMVLVTMITVLMSVFLVPTGYFQQVISSFVSSAQGVNEGFTQSSIPTQNPFGGIGMSYTSITAGFLDPAYFLNFGKNHTGIDLVPNDEYYKSSKTYAETKKIIVYATHTGTANFYTDGKGGETVEVTNNDASLKSIYIHFKEVYVNTGDTIQAGTPLGEMGKTGFATGEHLHYEIRIKDGNNWLPVNPLTYIK